MKKKIKDLTLEEIKSICNKYSYFDCFSCPLVNCLMHTHYFYYKNKNFEEMRIEIND